MRVFDFPAGRVEVGVAGRFEANATGRCESPERLTMAPDEARAMAVALIEHAAEVERRNKGRKR